MHKKYQIININIGARVVESLLIRSKCYINTQVHQLLFFLLLIFRNNYLNSSEIIK